MDVNTAKIMPKSPSPGYVPGNVLDNYIQHKAGVATGSIHLEVVGPDEIENNNQFQLSFKDSPTRYSVKDLNPVEEKLPFL